MGFVEPASKKPEHTLPADLLMAIWSGFVDYSQIYSASRGGGWDGQFVLSPAFNSSLLDITYDLKTRQNTTLTGQERQGGVQLKVCRLCFVIF